MMSIEMTRKSLYEIINKKIDQKFEFLENHFKIITKCPENKHGSLRHALKTFKFQFKQKWTAASNKEERFLTKNEQWVNNSITLPTWTKRKPARPAKDFKESSEQTKRRKTKALRVRVPCEQLTYAAQMSQRAAGYSDASKVMKDMTLTPTRAKKYRTRFISTQKDTVKKHTPSQALSIFVEADMTIKQYEVVHAANMNIYPCYSLVKMAKKECYPREESIRVTETCAEINMQDVLDHTSARLCMYLVEVLASITEEEETLKKKKNGVVIVLNNNNLNKNLEIAQTLIQTSSRVH